MKKTGKMVKDIRNIYEYQNCEGLWLYQLQIMESHWQDFTHESKSPSSITQMSWVKVTNKKCRSEWKRQSKLCLFKWTFHPLRPVAVSSCGTLMQQWSKITAKWFKKVCLFEASFVEHTKEHNALLFIMWCGASPLLTPGCIYILSGYL